MNEGQLLRYYERVADAPAAIPRLRRLVLDLAVRGRLFLSGTADQPLHADVLQVQGDPVSWPLASLGDVADCLDSMRQPVNEAERNLRIAGKRTDELVPYYGATRQQGWIDDFLFDEELVLLGEDGVPFFDPLRPKAYVVTGKSWVNNHAHVFRGRRVTNRFLAHCLNATDYSGLIAGATRTKLNQSKALGIPLAVPPLAEQERIVAKVDELMALCDRLEAARAEREAARDRLTAASLARLDTPDLEAFADDIRFFLNAMPALTGRVDQVDQLRQAILSLAVRGRLVAQDPHDAPVDQLLERLYSEGGVTGATARVRSAEPRSPFPVDEIELNLPGSWGWIRAQHAARPGQTITYGILKPEWVDAGVPTVRVTEMKTGTIDVRSLPKCAPARAAKFEKTRLEVNDLLVSKDGTIGKTAFVPIGLEGGNITQHVLRFPVSSVIDRHFVRLFIDSPVCQRWLSGETKGVALQGVNVGDFRRMPIPLPPLAEQRRIVAKVNELMLVCDQLEASLRAAAEHRSRLLQALLRDALESAHHTDASAAVDEVTTAG